MNKELNNNLILLVADKAQMMNESSQDSTPCFSRLCLFGS